MNSLSKLQDSLGIHFKDTDLLQLALVHSSYVNENPELAPVSNERLEFLGDAVLGLVVAERLYHDLPNAEEGELTRLRSALVCRETLATIAARINLGQYLSLGIGEESGDGRNKPANLAGAFEALVAAIYLDQGIEIAREFILRLFGEEMYSQAHQGAGTNYKSRLQEILQARFQTTPVYQVIEAVGPDHAKQFTIEVKAGTKVLGRGTGKSKKAAEMEAARIALNNL